MKTLRSEFELDRANEIIRGDYQIVAGDGAVEIEYYYENFGLADDEFVYSLDFEPYPYNDQVIDDFWTFNYDFFADELSDLDYKEYFTIVHRKGKKFYIIENYFLLSKNIDDTYTYYMPDNAEKRETLKRLIDLIETTLLNLEIESFIYNEFYFNENTYNYSLVSKIKRDYFIKNDLILEFCYSFFDKYSLKKRNLDLFVKTFLEVKRELIHNRLINKLSAYHARLENFKYLSAIETL